MNGYKSQCEGHELQALHMQASRHRSLSCTSCEQRQGYGVTVLRCSMSSNYAAWDAWMATVPVLVRGLVQVSLTDHSLCFSGWPLLPSFQLTGRLHLHPLKRGGLSLCGENEVTLS